METAYFRSGSGANYWSVRGGRFWWHELTAPDGVEKPFMPPSRDRIDISQVNRLRAAWVPPAPPLPPPAKCPFVVEGGYIVDANGERLYHRIDDDADLERAIAIIFAAGQVAGMAAENQMHREDHGLGCQCAECKRRNVATFDSTAPTFAQTPIDMADFARKLAGMPKVDNDSTVKPDPYDGLQGGDR